MAEAQAQTARIGRGGEIALAIIGGVFGLGGALFAITVGAVDESLNAETATSTATVGGWAAMGFSALAIVSAFFVKSRAKVAGWLLLVSAIGGLVSISFFYIIPFILLLIAGLMALLRGRR
ncbi:MAG: DUF4064 domain-containing protein [bacterium]|nr:DUF4064 domain-containing protein [bacterium]